MNKLVSSIWTILLVAGTGAATAAPAAAPAGADGATHVLAPERMRALLPASLGNLERGDISAERVTALGVKISEAEAQYRDDSGHYITLRIEDTGGGSGLDSLVRWASAASGKQTSSGDEKTYRLKGRIVHEQWDPPTASIRIGYGKYAVIVGRRYLVEASGKVAGKDALHHAVASVDLEKLESLH